MVLISDTRKLSKQLKQDLRCRAAIEPEPSHMKSVGLLGQNFLKGIVVDLQNGILSVDGHNRRKILDHFKAPFEPAHGQGGSSAP